MFRGRNHIGAKLRVAVEWKESVRLFIGPGFSQLLFPLNRMGFPVTLQGRILRRSCPMTKTQCRTPKVSVGTVKKSIAAMVSRWFLRYVSSRTFGREGVWSAFFPVSRAR